MFQYYFNHTPASSVNFPGRIGNYSSTVLEGAFHGAEIPFVLGDSGELVGDGELSLSQVMGKLWANFIATGMSSKR